MAALEDLEKIRECFHDNVDCNNNVGGRRNPRLIAVAAGSEMMMMKLNPLENHGTTTTTTTTHLVHAVASCDGYHEKEPAAAAAAGQYSQNQLLLTSFMMALIILLFSVQALFFQRNSRSSSSLAAHNNNYQQQQQQHFQVAYDHLSVDRVHGQTGGGKSAVRELPKNSAHEEVALIPCSGHGYMIQSNQLQQAEEEEAVAADHIVSRGGRPRVSSDDGVCKCHACYGGPDCSCQSVPECIIDLDHGDPTMYEAFWLVNGASSTTVIPGWQRMSYFAAAAAAPAAHTSTSSRVEQQQQAVAVWFMEHELDVQIRALHAVVGNAITEGRHIVVGTGSTQLYQAALYALSSPEQSKPTSVISAAPYYSSYPVVTDYLRSALFRWAGDATTFKLQQQSSDPNAAEEEEEQRYIELVTSPNNPDGRIQHAVVNGSGPVIHDLAYYWPHYTPITAPADHDLMLFTLSKCTGHAGTRIGWAIVKDAAVAKKMVKFVELNTIGVSQDSQIRATQILKAVIQGCNNYGHQGNRLQLQEADQDSANSNAAAADPADQMTISQHIQNQNLFHYGHSIMSYRWNRLRAAVGSSSSSTFSLLDFSPDQCTFFGKNTTPTPAFAWLQCNKEVDCQAFLKARGIISRSGRHFGVGPEFVRLSMLERSHSFELVVQRLASCSSPA